MYLFSYYHWLSKRLTSIPKDSQKWPDSWKNVTYKTYDGTKTYSLPDYRGAINLLQETDIRNLLKSRSTQREFGETNIFSEERLSGLLGYACGENGRKISDQPRRTYPSGGGLYPIEVYVYLQFDCGAIPAGLYHYRSDYHLLEMLMTGDQVTNPSELFTYDWTENAAGAILLTGVFGRSADKYGERSYRYALLEAGHIGQNLYLIGEALQLKMAALGGTRDVYIEELLEIDGYNEALVYAVVFG